MQKLKSKFPYLALFLLIFAFFLLKLELVRDDLWFQQISITGDWISTRYHTWSSRLVIEIVMICLLQLPTWVFSLLTALLCVQLAAGLAWMIDEELNLYLRCVLCLLFMIYPLAELSSAGWVSTCLNYLWPLSFGIVALFPLRQAMRGAPLSRIGLLYSAACMIFACNQEQMCALIIGFYAVGIGSMLYARKKVNPSIWLLALLAICSFLFIMTCPGNGARFEREVDAWYPQYREFGLMAKAFLGVVSTVATIFDTKNILFLLLVLFLAYRGIREAERGTAFVFLSCSPALCFLFFSGFLQDYLGQEEITQEFNQFADLVNPALFSKPYLAFVLAVSASFVLAMVAALFVQVDRPKRLEVALVLLAGFASRFLMGFSPTLYASLTRTFSYLYFAVIFCLVCLARKLSFRREKSVFLLVLAFFAVCQYIGLYLNF